MKFLLIAVEFKQKNCISLCLLCVSAALSVSVALIVSISAVSKVHFNLITLHILTANHKSIHHHARLQLNL